MSNTATLADFRSAIHDLRNGVESFRRIVSDNSGTYSDADKETATVMTVTYVDAIREVFANRHGNDFETLPEVTEEDNAETVEATAKK